MGFIDLDKAYDKVKSFVACVENEWCGIKSINVESIACVKEKGGETRVYHVPLAFQCIYEHSDEGGKDGDGKDRSEISGGGERVEIT